MLNNKNITQSISINLKLILFLNLLIIIGLTVGMYLVPYLLFR